MRNATTATDRETWGGASPSLRGIHHLKFPVRDIATSLAFYERALGAQRVAAWDHVHADGTRYAVIVEVPGLGTRLELRHDPVAAARQRGFDPVILAVRDRADLHAWIGHLDRAGIAHSPVLTAIQAWLLVFADPDARRIRLYTLETHGPDLPPDETSPWLTAI
jgi:catechol 2,3-dioxygenase-like lactoylglutathione lyase family enzyme